jgi:hypothetical protein
MQCVFLRIYSITPLFSYSSLLRSRHLTENRSCTVFILGSGGVFHIHKELARLWSLKYTTNGERLSFKINETLTDLEN